jgi:hypothetical protein
MAPVVGFLTAPRGQWRVVHRLHAPACPYSQVFGGWTELLGVLGARRRAERAA